MLASKPSQPTIQLLEVVYDRAFHVAAVKWFDAKMRQAESIGNVRVMDRVFGKRFVRPVAGDISTIETIKSLEPIVAQRHPEWVDKPDSAPASVRNARVSGDSGNQFLTETSVDILQRFHEARGRLIDAMATELDIEITSEPQGLDLLESHIITDAKLREAERLRSETRAAVQEAKDDVSDVSLGSQRGMPSVVDLDATAPQLPDTGPTIAGGGLGAS